MKSIAIIGGGISGLSAAYYLERARRKGAALEYALFESAERLGGVMGSERIDRCLVEAGPDSFLSEKPAAAELCRALGLEDQLMGSNDARRKTFILVRGHLVAMPDGLQFMVPTKILPTLTTRLFSAGAKLRLVGEFFAQPRPAEDDESVAEFVSRHFGKEVVERLADPLLSGVYGGEAEKLSMRAVLPRFLDLEARHGSLSRGMLAARRRTAAQSANGTRPLFTSMKEGMQQLVDGLVGQLDPAALRTSAAIRAVGREQGRWVVLQQDGAAQFFDCVVLAVPAYVAAALLRTVQAALAAVLNEITYSSSVTVALGYDAARFNPRVSEGFGFLVPRSEGKRMLALTFVHNKFPHRAPEDRRLLRVFLGGSRDAGVLSLPDDQILETIRRELREILGLTAEPGFARIFRWHRAMAQYEVGHLERVARIERLRGELPGLALIGNAYRGIGVPDCIKSGRDAAQEMLGSPAAP